MAFLIWPDGRCPVKGETVELRASCVASAWELIRCHIARKRPDWIRLRRFWVLYPGRDAAELWRL